MKSFFNYRLTESLDEVQPDQNGARPMVVSCLNPHSFVTALDDGEFRTSLEDSDYLLPDGDGVDLAMRLCGGSGIKKIAGDDLYTELLRRLDITGGRVFFMGSSNNVLKKIEERMSVEHPGITVKTLSPSYCDALSVEESMSIVSEIEAFKPDVLFVSMTAPKQEKWVHNYIELLKTPKLIASIGAVFGFYAGTERRAPKWALKLKLEWLVRFLRSPRRMWRRIFVSNPKFLFYVWRHRLEFKE